MAVRAPRRFAIAALLLLAAGTSVALAAWDETQLELLRQYSTPLRWYNVEGRPDWVSGPKPNHDFGSQIHFLHLQPGEEVTLRATAHTWLRLAGEEKALSPDDLEVSVSTDARAFADVTSINTSDPHQLLIALPQDKPSLVRLTRPRHAQSKLVFAACFLVEDPFPTLAPYPEAIRLPGETVRLRRDDEDFSQTARLVKPAEVIEFPIEGPARVQLVARLPWPTDEPRQEQAITLLLKLDGVDSAPLLLAPELDDQHRTRVNHSTELVSFRMNGYINVPDGKHTLRLQSTVPIYLSAFRQTHSDLLFSSLNGPATNAMQVLRSALNPLAVSARSAIISNFPTSLSRSDIFVDQEQAAWRLARDNSPLDAGAQAADWLNRVGQTRLDYPAARQTVAALWRQRTFFREILPARQSGNQPLRQAFFSPARMLERFEPQRPIAVYNPTMEQVRELLAEGSFAPVPPTPASPLLYQLPARSYDSELRIAAVASGPARTHFFVQFDQEPPVKVVLDPKSALPVDELAPSTAIATLRVLEHDVELPSNRKLKQPVGEFDLPSSIAEPGVIELRLPQGVRQVRIYQEPPTIPVQTSIAYRAAKAFEFGEAGYRSLLSQVSSNEVMQILAGTRTALSAAASQPADKAVRAPGEPLRQLQNHFLPLIRLLKVHENDFTKNIDSGSAPEDAAPALSTEEATKLKDAARSLEREGRPIEAIESWNRLFWEGAIGDRPEAALSIMRNLQSLGEDFLATQYARYALRKAPATQAPAAAIALLENDARQADEPEQLEQVRAYLFISCPCPDHLVGLIEAFALNARDELVVSAGLLLPVEQRPKELMLAAALHLNWWQTFDQLVEALLEAEMKSFWRAQKHLAFYQFAEAEQDLKQAGTKGVEMLTALQEGIRIRERLAATDLDERLDAVFAWEQWQSQQPGPRTWRKAEDIVYRCSAAELLFNREQNQFAQHFRSEPGQPVKLRFVGPVRLQIEARPVLDLPFERPVDDWLEISEYGIANRVPVFQCVPNPSLPLTTASNAVAGLKTTADLEWGPGLHEVEVGLAGRSGLIRVLQEQPVLPVRILPALNVGRMNLVLAGRKLPTQRSDVSQDDGLWWVDSESAHPDSRTEWNAALTPTRPAKAGLRFALRMPSDPEHSPKFNSAELQALPLAEQWLAACRWQRWNDFTNWQALPEVERANYLLATHRIRQVLDSAASRDVLQRLTTLLRVAEEFPAWRKEAQSLGELLAAETNCPPGCKKILLRLTDDLTWVPLPISPSSAGIRRLEVAADMPLDPSARIRRALLPPTGTNEFTLAGQNAFNVSMTLQHPAQLDVRLELAKVGFSPLIPLTVSLQIDALDVQHLLLSPPDATAGTNFMLAVGPHQVRLWIEDPVANQFVRINLSGQSEGVTNSIWSRSLAEAASENRFLHAATTAQPIRFSWNGPALLRLDEWRDGRFLNQFRLVPPGAQTVEIRPAPGFTESSYRILVRATETNQPEARPAWTIRQPAPVPPPELRLPESIPPSQVQLTDYYRIAGQEDGTWTAGLMLAKRRPFDLEGQQTVNEFVEANGTYRKVTPSDTLWFATEGLARVHRPGDLTFGLSERIEGRPRNGLLDWSWTGEGFVGSAGPQQQDIQASLYTTFELGPRYQFGRKFEYYPFASVFARYLTMDPAQAATYNYIDQDLYTQFRYDHRWGLVLGNQLEYKPWLDTRLKAYADVASNEDFSPDHWGVRVAWNQLFGPVRSEVAYRYTHYLVDDDRPFASSIQGISAGVYAERWINGRHRLELGVQFRHDWPDSGNSFFLVLNWDFSRGRGYKDRSPDEMLFRDLRSRRIPKTFNNLFQPGPPGASLP